MFCIFWRQKRVFASRLRCEENIFCLYVCTLFFYPHQFFLKCFSTEKGFSKSFPPNIFKHTKAFPLKRTLLSNATKEFRERSSYLQAIKLYVLSPRIHFSGNVHSHVIVCFLLCMHIFIRILIRYYVYVINTFNLLTYSICKVNVSWSESFSQQLIYLLTEQCIKLLYV